MSQVLVNETSLTAIANAIREKNGETTTYKPSEMSGAISALSVGTENGLLPLSILTTSAPYKYTYNNWNDVLNEYGDMIETIDGAEGMFQYSDELKNVNFTVVLGTGNNSGLFGDCYKLKKVDVKMSANPVYTYYTGLFSECYSLTDIPENAFQTTGTVTGMITNLFYDCRTLRKHPDLLPLMQCRGGSYLFYNCYQLDEITNYPVGEEITFVNSFYNCSRLKTLTFAPITGSVSWNNTTINLSNYVGYCANTGIIINEYSNLNGATRVYNTTTYNSLKNNDDYWADTVEYSRYNKLSAIATINSLPTTTGTNVITFKGDSGKYTDGGAINTMTEEEIAVATAKGFTVSFV